MGITLHIAEQNTRQGQPGWGGRVFRKPKTINRPGRAGTSLRRYQLRLGNTTIDKSYQAAFRAFQPHNVEHIFEIFG